MIRQNQKGEPFPARGRPSGSVPESRGDPDGARDLREFLAVLQQLPYLCLVPAALIILPTLVTQHHVPEAAFILAGLVVAVPWFARAWYRWHPNSLNAFSLLYSVGALCLTGGLLGGMWESRHFSRLSWLYSEFLTVYLVAFVATWVLTAVFLIRRGRTLREKYQYLRGCLPCGTITDYQLWRWISPVGTTVRGLKWRISAAGGFAIFGTMLAAVLGGRAGLGYFYFLAALLLVAVLLAIVSARMWANWKYLRGRDLNIVWTDR